jgi:hypothetical protein
MISSFRSSILLVAAGVLGLASLATAPAALAAPSAPAATATATLPEYVEITRSGTTFSAYTSPDESTWTLVPGSTVTLANLSGSLLRGFAVTSHNTGQFSTAVFNSVVTSP